MRNDAKWSIMMVIIIGILQNLSINTSGNQRIFNFIKFFRAVYNVFIVDIVLFLRIISPKTKDAINALTI